MLMPVAKLNGGVITSSGALGLIVLVPRAKLNGEVAMPSRSTRLDQCEAQRLGCDPSGALGSMFMTTRSTLMNLDDGDAFLVAQSFQRLHGLGRMGTPLEHSLYREARQRGGGGVHYGRTQR